MALVVVQAELMKTLGLSCDEFDDNGYQIGLFKNGLTPSSGSVIGDITPANFTGYDGVHLLGPATVIVWSSPRAVASFADALWTCTGSAVPNDIYGYYVIDGDGELAWLELRGDGPVTIGTGGQTYTVEPVFTRRSEF